MWFCNVGMAEQSGDDAQALAPADRDRRVRMSQIVNAQRRQSRRRADRVPFLVHRSQAPPQGDDANTQGQLVRR